MDLKKIGASLKRVFKEKPVLAWGGVAVAAGAGIYMLAKRSGSRSGDAAPVYVSDPYGTGTDTSSGSGSSGDGGIMEALQEALAGQQELIDYNQQVNAAMLEDFNTSYQTDMQELSGILAGIQDQAAGAAAAAVASNPGGLLVGTGDLIGVPLDLPPLVEMPVTNLQSGKYIIGGVDFSEIANFDMTTAYETGTGARTGTTRLRDASGNTFDVADFAKDNLVSGRVKTVLPTLPTADEARRNINPFVSSDSKGNQAGVDGPGDPGAAPKVIPKTSSNQVNVTLGSGQVVTVHKDAAAQMVKNAVSGGYAAPKVVPV